MSEHNFVGQIGEDLARKYLEERGYSILEQNYKTRYSEVDLVAEKNGEMIFVEVRTKVGENFGTPEDTLNRKKLSKVRFNALSYAGYKKWQGPIKIDAICIVLNPNHTVLRLNHYENIV